MRIPCKLTDDYRTHFLTDFYAEEKFHLPMLPFINECDNAYLKFYDNKKVRIKGKM